MKGPLLAPSALDRGCDLYRAILADHDRANAVAEAIERLWERYRPLATPHFVAEFPRQTHQRLWEMVLAGHLLNAGVPLESQPDAAPDLGFRSMDGRRVWIEAVCATPGALDRPDSVPPLRSVSETGIAEQVASREILLRFSQAVDAKRRQWARHVRAGRVSVDDAYVIALNTGQIDRTWFGDVQGFALKALFGVGDLEVSFDTRTGRVAEARYGVRFQIEKRNGASVATTLFATDEAQEVSAILCSAFHAGRLLETDRLHDLTCIHNPFGRVAIPEGWLPVEREIVGSLDGPDHLLLRG